MGLLFWEDQMIVACGRHWMRPDGSAQWFSFFTLALGINTLIILIESMGGFVLLSNYKSTTEGSCDGSVQTPWRAPKTVILT